MVVILDHQADVNARDGDGRTTLHFAVNRGNLELVRLLLDRKADPDAKDASGQTALTMAAAMQGAPHAHALGLGRTHALGGSAVVGPVKPEDIIALLRERGAKDSPKTEPGTPSPGTTTKPEKPTPGQPTPF